MTLYLVLILCLFLAVIALVIWVFRLKKSLKEHFMLERELQYEVGHDELTDLVSISVAIDRLSQSIKNAKRYDVKIAALYLGVDYFKQINSASDFDITNEFLQKLSERLVEIIGKADTVARVNENEFIIILEGFEDIQTIQTVVQELLDSSQETFIVQHHKMTSEFCIGISMFPNENVGAMTLLSHAYTAMELVKNRDGEGYKFYTPELAKQSFENTKLEHELIDSLEFNQIEVHYQLVYNAEDKKSIGIEAYARWRHPLMGLIPASKFIRLSEEIGYIVDIDRWVVQEAIKQCKQWQKIGLDVGTLFLNTSLTSFGHESFIQDIKTNILEDESLKNMLYFEIKQGQIIDKHEGFIKKLENLNTLGSKFSIDNCGSSHFSLVEMKALPLNMLKIDHHLIVNLDENKEIIKGIIAIAKNLGLSTTANGVETQEQYDFLLENKCMYIQGDYFHEASSASIIENILKKQV